MLLKLATLAYSMGEVGWPACRVACKEVLIIIHKDIHRSLLIFFSLLKMQTLTLLPPVLLDYNSEHYLHIL